ncbi:YdcF family protein [soil metagenome]
MHKLASYISAFILSPIHWILLFVIAGFLIRNKRIRKACRIIALLFFIVFSSPLLMNWLSNKWQTPRGVINTSKKYSCGIVLGGFASLDADESAYFNGAADRFIQVLKLYKVGEIQHILISGGNSKAGNENFREAAWVKNELLVMGVPDSVILIEDLSNNTLDNARNSKALLDSNHLQPPYLLITSAYHMPRAALLFNKAGVTTEPFAGNYSGAKRSFSISMLLPQLSVLSDWEGYLKEMVGYWWYK